MCLARGGVRAVGWEDCVWALPILDEHGESGICVCVLVVVVWVVLAVCAWTAWAMLWEGRVVLRLCECGFFVLMAGPGICILCKANSCVYLVQVFNHVAPYRYQLPNWCLSVADIADLFAYGSLTWINLDIAPIDGGGRVRHNVHRVCQTAVTAPPRVCYVVWSDTSFVISAMVHFTLDVNFIFQLNYANNLRSTEHPAMLNRIIEFKTAIKTKNCVINIFHF